MAHVLRYGASVHASILRANPKHNFAHTHAMLLYDSNAVYSMIPKNGCTTLRVSIALANGLITDKSDWGWIHSNNDSFRPSLRELAVASYRFTILRCPYARLVSCFLDKIAKHAADAAAFVTAAQIDIDLDKLTFRRFCEEMAKPAVRASNIHWRPQIEFLVYADYDDYFCFEAFDEIAPRLKAKAGLNIVDARPLARHDSSHYRMVDAAVSFADVELFQLEAMMLNGFYPNPKCFYDDRLRQVVQESYRDDFALYRAKHKGKGLLGGQSAPATEPVRGRAKESAVHRPAG